MNYFNFLFITIYNIIFNVYLFRVKQELTLNLSYVIVLLNITCFSFFAMNVFIIHMRTYNNVQLFFRHRNKWFISWLFILSCLQVFSITMVIFIARHLLYFSDIICYFCIFFGTNYSILYYFNIKETHFLRYVYNNTIRNLSQENIIINNDPDITCSICLDDLNDSETVYEYPLCKHKFHIDCIKFWLKHRCPNCNIDLDESV